MKYACNFSKELMELLSVEPDVCDYIKIGDFGPSKAYMDQCFQLKPLLIHGFGWFERGGMADTSMMDFHYMNKRLARFKTPYLGMHAMAFRKDIAIYPDTLKHMIAIFNEVKDKIACELLFENMDYSMEYSYETTVKETVMPDFYSRLADSCQLKMLLDTSHALVSAYQLQMNIYDYLEALPLDRVREIHISGSFKHKHKGYMDVHGVMTEEDREIISFLARHPKICNSDVLQMITLEYGSVNGADIEAIRKQLALLKKTFKQD